MYHYQKYLVPGFFRCSVLLVFIFLLSPIELNAQCDYSKPTRATENGACDENEWVLVFEDNFDGNTLDLNKWEIQPHSQGAVTGAANQEYNSLDNVSVSEGIMKVELRKETVQRKAVNWHPKDKLLSDSLPNLRTYHYTAAVIWTHKQFMFGKYEISCTIPKGKGVWPAFWMFTGDNGIWNEIDVFEFGNVYGLKFLRWGGRYKPEKSVRRVRTNAHYDFGKDGGHDNCPRHKDMTDISVGLHTFELIWTPFTMEWIVDGVSIRKKYKYTKFWGIKKIDCNDYQAGKKYRADMAFPMEEMNIIVGSGVRSGRHAPDSTSATFPCTMQVDYIRYYKR